MAGAVVAVIVLVLGLGMVDVQSLVCTQQEDALNKGCNKTVSELFTVEMFEGMFKHRNDRVAHAQGFWSYGSFISAAKTFAVAGFGSVGGHDLQKRELAAFFAHVAHETSCKKLDQPEFETFMCSIMIRSHLLHADETGDEDLRSYAVTICCETSSAGGWPGAKDGPSAWGLCYNQELSPNQDYCKTEDLLYPCAPSATYYGRGALPLYWNYNYGPTGVALKQDLLHHPELLAFNETIAWQAAIWYWMTPAKTRPSPHQVMVGKWLPSRNDTISKRQPGFGMTINIRASNGECGHGDNSNMQDRIAHYIYFLQGYFGVTDPGPYLDCGSQGVVLEEYAAL